MKPITLRIFLIYLLRTLGACVLAQQGSSSTSSCDASSLQMVQTITGPVNIFYIGIVSPDWCKQQPAEWVPSASLPRFTWTLEPAPEGATETTVMMSPPDLGTLLFDLNYDGVGSVDGIKINPTLNLTNGTDVGIVARIPRDQPVIVSMLSGAPFYVNIAKGFTNISGLESERSNDETFYCSGGEYQTNIAGRGSAVVADLSSTLGGWGVISIQDNGADWTVKLPEDDKNDFNLDIFSYNAKVLIQGHLNCTGTYDCKVFGGSQNGCVENCATELVVDGNISGNIPVYSWTPQPPFGEEYTGNATVMITTTEPNGCDHFSLDDSDETPFECTVDAGAVVELEEFPCITVSGEGGALDVLQCQGESLDQEHICNCAVPGVCPAPSPTPTPSSTSSYVNPRLAAAHAAAIYIFYSTFSLLF